MKGLKLFIILAAVITNTGLLADQHIADLVPKLMPSVVNISTTQVNKDKQELQFALPPGSSSLESILRELFDIGGERLRKSTSLGSGFIIDSSGYVLTNYHVISDADDITVTLHDDTELKAKVVGKDKKSDIALLKVTPGKALQAVQWGDSNSARVGDGVIVIGNPLSLGGTVTSGIISCKARDISAKFKEIGVNDIDYIQTDAPINRGNSGGPLFTMDGKVIGMVTAIFSETGFNSGLNFAIPSGTLQKVVEQLKSFGKIKRGWLGVYIDPLTAEVAESLGLGKARGGTIVRVFPDSPASRAGFQQGDIIIAVNGQPITDGKKLSRIISDLPIGKVIPIKVVRNGKELTLSVTVGDREEGEDVAEDYSKGSVSETIKGKAIDSLGVSIEELSAKLRRTFDIPSEIQGVVIIKVKKDSEAADKDMRAGDVITRINQEAISNVKDFESKVEKAKANRPSVALLVYREGVSFYRALSFKKKEKKL